MRGNEEDRARVLEDYAKSIKALRKMRPTSSTQYLKLRAAKRRAEARSFASSLALEEKRRKIEVRTQVKEANKWAIMLNSGHSYTVVDDPHAGVFGMSVKVLKPNRKSLTGGAGEGASDSSTHVMKKLSIAAFQREHDRMKVEVDRDKALRAISTGGAAAGGGDRGGGSDGVNAMAESGGGRKRPMRGRSRKGVQTELKSILQDTERLTTTLVSQLRELKFCGWNVGYL
jgi:hypothetical protein